MMGVTNWSVQTGRQGEIKLIVDAKDWPAVPLPEALEYIRSKGVELTGRPSLFLDLKFKSMRIEKLEDGGYFNPPRDDYRIELEFGDE